MESYTNQGLMHVGNSSMEDMSVSILAYSQFAKSAHRWLIVTRERHVFYAELRFSSQFLKCD